jgi:hypothetical protein
LIVLTMSVCLIKFCKIWLYIDPMLGATLMVIPVFGASVTFFNFCSLHKQRTGILALRTYALYHQKRIFKWILVFLFIVCIPVLITLCDD